MRRTLTTRHLGRLLATTATVAIAATATGCGLADPMADQGTTPAKTAAVATAAASSRPATATTDAARAAAQRFVDAYTGLLNGGGGAAERQLRVAAAPKLAAGLILASQDAQLAGDATTTSSTHLVTLAPASGGHWRATFATGRTRWAMLLDVPAQTAAPVVTAAATQPAT